MSNQSILEVPSQLILSAATNQLVLGRPEAANYYTVSAAAPAANRTLTIVDPLVASNVVISSQGTVTQGTSTTTTVVLSNPSGAITCFTSTLAAVTSISFTVTNTFCTASSVVLANICNYSGTYETNGIPVVAVSTVAAGSFKIEVSNAHSSNALSGILSIAFLVC